VRDLGRVDPWQESLQRSRARRARPASPEPAGRQDPSRRDRARLPTRSRRPGPASQSKLMTVGSWGVLVVTVIMVTVGGLVDGHGAQASADASRARSGRPHVTALPPSRGSNRAPARVAGTCRPVPNSTGYVNPVAGDVLVSERIDQGVDYAGSGTLTAIGRARITYVGTGETGWPGAFIEYRLLTGPDTGCFVYYAEGLTPAAGLRPGQRVRAGQVLANIIPGWATGIELGWGAGVSTKTYAEKTGRWTATDDADSVASAAGKSFSSLIAGLGGPAGRVEG
jgi:hypothetical protein